MKSRLSVRCALLERAHRKCAILERRRRREDKSHQQRRAMESGQMSKLQIAVIIGSTRDVRFGPKPAQWIFELARDAGVQSFDARLTQERL